MIQAAEHSAVNESPLGLMFLDPKHSKIGFRIERIMRTIITETNSCMRATAAVERFKIRRTIIWVPKFISLFERAGCNNYFGRLGARSNTTELYLEILCD